MPAEDIHQPHYLKIPHIETDCLFNKLVLALAVIPFTEFFDQLLCFGSNTQSELDFFSRHTFLQSKIPDLCMARDSFSLRGFFTSKLNAAHTLLLCLLFCPYPCYNAG